jgi:hypothetical protein
MSILPVKKNGSRENVACQVQKRTTPLFFPQLRVFNNFSALFLALFGFVFSPDHLFSTTSPVCFLKKVFFFVF